MVDFNFESITQEVIEVREERKESVDNQFLRSLICTYRAKDKYKELSHPAYEFKFGKIVVHITPREIEYIVKAVQAAGKDPEQLTFEQFSEYDNPIMSGIYRLYRKYIDSPIEIVIAGHEKVEEDEARS